MSYLALYRRFRPQVFEDIVGQETVVRALLNQIKTDKIAHAYLFCGARGTGKTTAAKIFARAINCEKKNGSPCGECATCQSLNDPNSLDIIEMDAASNNKVENAREIRDKVQYPPVSGRYKVYIIDEVHMLTNEAFNALLKTIEEPPKHAVFILATTEPHKLPATILSRCMRFDFKLISASKIAELIASIFDEVKKEYDYDAVMAIARAGEGSIRDALSIADICLSFKDSKLTYNDVIEVLGASDRGKTAKLVRSVFSADSGSALEVVDELIGLGKSVEMLIKDVLSYLRDVMVVKTCKSPEEILSLPKEEIQALTETANLIDNQGLLRIVEIISKIEMEVKYSTHARIIFETAIVKATTLSTDCDISSLMSRITKLENALKNGNFAIATEQKEDRANSDAIKASAQVEIKAEVKEETRTEAKEEFKAESTKEQTVQSQPEIKVAQRRQRVKNTLEEELSFLRDIDMGTVAEVAKPEINDSQVSLESPKNYVSSVPDRRIWGTLIKKLRESGNTMLWVICQELKADVSSGVITIYASSDSEYKSLEKAENKTKLKEILSGICNYEVKVLPRGEVKDTFEEDIEEIKRNFDNVEVLD